MNVWWVAVWVSFFWVNTFNGIVAIRKGQAGWSFVWAFCAGISLMCILRELAVI